ncbi:unnamed protein product, partial [Cyprideis torosa]
MYGLGWSLVVVLLQSTYIRYAQVLLGATHHGATALCVLSPIGPPHPSIMSLGPENAEDILARVLAQVMRRDVTTECWQLYAGGGIAVITVYKKEKPDGQTEFRCVAYLEGRLVMSCDFLGDLIYYRVTPTFHHWLSDNARNGFTFQNSKDADVFAAAVKKCVEHLLNVFLVDYDWSETLKKRWLQKMLQLKGLLEPPANLLLAQRFFNNVDSFVKLAEKLDDDEELGDDDVFMSVDLPREQRSEARTQAQTSGARRALAQMEQARQHRLRNANGDAMLAASSGSRPSTSRAASAAYRLAASASRVARKAFKKFPGTAARVPSTTRNAPSTSRKSEAAVRGMELLGAVGGSLEDDSSKEESSSSYHYPIIHQPQSETSPSHFRHCFPSHTISSPVVNQPARSKKPEDSKYPHLSRSRQEVDGKIYAHSDPGGKNFDRIQSIPSSFSDSTLIPVSNYRPFLWELKMNIQK